MGRNGRHGGFPLPNAGEGQGEGDSWHTLGSPTLTLPRRFAARAPPSPVKGEGMRGVPRKQEHRGGDSLYIAKGEMAQSNAQQVHKIRRILEELSLEPATPAQAREMLGLKGADRVAF